MKKENSYEKGNVLFRLLGNFVKKLPRQKDKLGKNRENIGEYGSQFFRIVFLSEPVFFICTKKGFKWYPDTIC